MRYRMLDANGDYVFGQGSANFWINDPRGVAQSVQTRLNLWQGEWFLDQTAGTPIAQQVLGYGTESLYDIVIKQRILSTAGVTTIVEYQSERDPETRELVVGPVTVQTQYSATPVVVPQVTVI